jgi:hypothetical protein
LAAGLSENSFDASLVAFSTTFISARLGGLNLGQLKTFGHSIENKCSRHFSSVPILSENPIMPYRRIS